MFNTVFYLMLLSTIIAIIISFLTFDFGNNFRKDHKILTINQTSKEIFKLSSSQNQAEALVMLNIQKIKLQENINSLKSLYELNILQKFLVDKAPYISQVDRLKNLADKLISEVELTLNTKQELDIEPLYIALSDEIESFYVTSLEATQKAHNIIFYIEMFLLLSIVLSMLLHRGRLKLIHGDIIHLLNPQNSSYEFKTKELEALLLRGRKHTPQPTKNSAFIDINTDLPNQYALYDLYRDKKKLKESGFSSICLYSVDSFDLYEYSQEFKDSVYKKIASILKLYEKPTDTAAKISENEFAFILQRDTKEQCLKDSKDPYENISSLKFSYNQKSITLSISAGYIIKPNNITLEESIKSAKKLLDFAKKHGGNRLMQVEDLAASEM